MDDHDREIQAPLRQAAQEMRRHLDDGLIPFWDANARDVEHGGYLTRFGPDGRSLGTPEKYLNTQCRLLWWFSTLARRRSNAAAHLSMARHGFDFIRQHFWDDVHGGWFWKTAANGARLDGGKIVYGQSFALYALAEFALASGDEQARRLAESTFDLLQIHSADTQHGGYLENLGEDWRPAGPGVEGGDRKSLDTHMHLLESFTVLVELTGKAVHRRKLLEVAALIRDRMIDPATGCGRNQFDLAFHPIPAVCIKRTWNDERRGETPLARADTTSYGHNVELAWLARRALTVAQEDTASWQPVLLRLVEHATLHGVDWQHGGVFREGTLERGATVVEKEFWQNSEALVGFLDSWEVTRNVEHAKVFLNIWTFVREKFIAPCGEWRVLLDREGRVLDGNVGNDWKVSYHTGRAVLECVNRLDRALGQPSEYAR